ncbi:MAG: heme ABC exporter ATP-binding protein CcmA, partial [Rubrivivax sp.]
HPADLRPGCSRNILSRPPPPPATPLLSARRLACRRGERLLFRDLDLDLLPGQILWLRGRNGCGKTSLLRVLAGLAPPEAGTLQRHSRSAYLAHANALKDDLGALEALQFLALLHGHAADSAACTEALRRVGMFERRRAAVRTLSQGQRRRVALARLFLEPTAAAWILDEPFDALDSDAVAMLAAALQAHARSGGAVVLTSHLEPPLHEPLPTLLQLDEITGS